MTNECPVCGDDMDDGEVASITINRDESVGRPCADDVVFDVSFPGNDALTSLQICTDCFNNNRHLTDEYQEEIES